MSTAPCDTAYDSISNWRRAGPRTHDTFLPKSSICYDRSYVDNIITCPCGRCKVHRNLLTPEGQQIGQINPTQYSEQIRSRHQSLFALLIWIKKPAFILPFAEFGVSDSGILAHLGDRALDEEFYVFRVIRANIAANGNADRGVLVELINQIEGSWTDFLRPCIGARTFEKISPRFKLPFYDQRRIGRGASSSVFAFKIHDGYNAIQNVEHITNFARKQMLISHHAEQQLTTCVNALNDDHIARLLTTYEHNDVDQNNLTFNMIFPRATTNLERYLRDPTLGLGQSNFANIFAAQIWQEVAGIANGLHKIHNMDGRWAVHLDLKPENILVDIDPRSRQPRLMIADFGVAMLRDPQRHGSRVQGGGGDEAYAPPERDGDRKYDIWSLGCILLEVLTYALEDVAGIGRLDAARGLNNNYCYPFWETTGGPPQIRQSVDHHMNTLSSIANHPGNLSGRGVRFVGRMLELIRWMFRINKDDRPRAGLVYQRIRLSLEDVWWSAGSGADDPGSAGGNLNQVFIVDRELPALPASSPNTNQEPRFVEPGPGWEELGHGITRTLRGLLARSSRYPTHEDERIQMQVFQQSTNARRELRLRVIFAHERDPRELPANRGALCLVPAYALREHHNNPRSYAGLRLVRHGDQESYFDMDFDGELNDLRAVHGVLMQQDICHTVQVKRVVIKRPQRSSLFGLLPGAPNQPPLLDHEGMLTVQLWKESGSRTGECRIVIYATAMRSEIKSGIWIIRFRDSFGFEPRVLEGADDKVLISYLNKNATAVYLSTFHPGENQSQPALPLDAEDFDTQCRNNREEFGTIMLYFQRPTDRSAFLSTYRTLKQQWEIDKNIRR